MTAILRGLLGQAQELVGRGAAKVETNFRPLQTLLLTTVSPAYYHHYSAYTTPRVRPRQVAYT